MKRFLFASAVLFLTFSMSSCDDDNNKRHSDNHDSANDNNVSLCQKDPNSCTPEMEDLDEVLMSYCYKMKGCLEEAEPDLEYNMYGCRNEANLFLDYAKKDSSCTSPFAETYACMNKIPCDIFFMEDEDGNPTALLEERDKCMFPGFAECLTGLKESNGL